MNKCPFCGTESDDLESSIYPCGTVKVDHNTYHPSTEYLTQMMKSLPEISNSEVLTTLYPSPFLCAPHSPLSEYKDNV